MFSALKSLRLPEFWPLWNFSFRNRVTPVSIRDGVSHWDHVRGDTDDPCGAIADFCGVIADFCGVIAIPEATTAARAPMRRRRSLRDSLSIIKHSKTL